MAYDQIADVIAENNALRYEIAILKGERDRLKLWQEDIQTREAAVCPEDVGFDEYIRTLKAEAAQVRSKALEELLRWIREEQCDTESVEMYIEELIAAPETHA